MNNHFTHLSQVQHSDFPWCHVEALATPQLVGAEKLFLVRATMPAKNGHNFHLHPEREEIIYVVAGELEQWVGQEKRLLKVGEIAHIPKGMPHASYNWGSETAQFLAMLSPAEAPGDFSVDVFNQEPWCTIRPPLPYPSV
jgi:quercetin dioxygenase-like cupin family protein